jgi:hypothetical protein
MRMASEAGDVPGMAIVDDPRGQQHLYVQDLDDPSRFIYARSKHMVQRQASEMIGPVHGLRP